MRSRGWKCVMSVTEVTPRRGRRLRGGSCGRGRMPVAVMAEGGFGFRKLLEQCETQELEAPGGIATPLVYGQLLALYLLYNDMNNARYLWKRIPPAIKSANAELGAVWSVGQRIWQRDFPGIYTTIGAHQWSETVQPIMEALRDATRRRAFGLVSQAYTSIVADDFAAFVGLPVEEAVKGVLEASFNRFIPSSGISCLCTVYLHMLKTCLINIKSFISTTKCDLNPRELRPSLTNKYNWLLTHLLFCPIMYQSTF
uniref:COP9 signalosome complex subunit 8 n=1 Tax=Meleagris gallopavo TaxID=9103 RepID=A0A803YMQ8_MELGA